MYSGGEAGPSSSSQTGTPASQAGTPASEWRPVFSVKAEGSGQGQIQKPTDVKFLGRDTVAVADYGNSRYGCLSVIVFLLIFIVDRFSNKSTTPYIRAPPALLHCTSLVPEHFGHISAKKGPFLSGKKPLKGQNALHLMIAP